MTLGPLTASSAVDRWYTDATLWTIVGVAVAVVLGVITVWAQFASARIVSRVAISAEVGPAKKLAEEPAKPRRPHGLDLSGEWIAGWQTFKDGKEVQRYQPVEIQHLDDDRMTIRALERGAEVVDGGYLWEGELRLWDNAILMGWYAATEGSIRSKGTLYSPRAVCRRSLGRPQSRRRSADRTVEPATAVASSTHAQAGTTSARSCSFLGWLGEHYPSGTSKHAAAAPTAQAEAAPNEAAVALAPWSSRWRGTRGRPF